MIAVVLPLGQTLAYWEPELIEAKSFSKTIAAFWLLYPKSEADTAVSISWSLTEFAHELDTEVERLNRAISLARRRDTATVSRRVPRTACPLVSIAANAGAIH